MAQHNQLGAEQRDALLHLLESRFANNMHRHPALTWENVRKALQENPQKLWSLNEMERTGGEPDVLTRDQATREFRFFDCSPESPKGRRSLCYDDAALRSRKEHKPENSVIEMATAIGIELLTEDHYRELQTFGEFDNKTSSWIHTPSRIRSLGGALFCDRRYDTVFVYHNGAESYYAARGFRGLLRV